VRAQQARQQPDDDGQRGIGDPAIQHGGEVHRADAPKGLPRLAHHPVGHVQLERRGQPRQGAEHQPEAGKRNEHEHRERGGVVGLDAVAQRVRVGNVVALARPGGSALQVLFCAPVQGWVVDLAQLAGRKNDRCRPGVLDQQALAHRPDEDKQPHDREQKGPQQTQYGAVHGWESFPPAWAGLFVDVLQSPATTHVL